MNVKLHRGGLLLRDGKGLDGNVQALVPVQRAGIAQDKAAIRITLAQVAVKDGGVGVIDEGGALVATDGATRDFLEPEVIGNDHVISEGGRPALDPLQGFEDQRVAAHAELGGVELGDDVVDVQDDLGPAQLGNQGRKHFEVRNRMDVHQVVGLVQLLARHFKQRSEEEPNDAPQVSELAPLVLFSVLDAQNPHAVDHLFTRLAFATQDDGVDLCPVLSQGFGITHDAAIGLVEGVGQHARPQGASPCAAQGGVHRRHSSPNFLASAMQS